MTIHYIVVCKITRIMLDYSDNEALENSQEFRTVSEMCTANIYPYN
jgi:hypothetical protein